MVQLPLRLRVMVLVWLAAALSPGLRAQELMPGADAAAEQEVGTDADSKENPEESSEETLLINDAQDPGTMLTGELSGFTIWDFLRMVLVLGAVIALIYALFLFLKRAGNPKTGDDDFITLLASQPLNGNRSLHLVQVGGEIFLIGSADGAVSLVSRIEDKEFQDRIALHQSGAKAGFRSFSGALRALLGENRRVEETDTAGAESLFLGKQKERLRKLQR